MEFIDSEGRIAGRINVVDALVVLVVAAVVVAGLSLVGVGTTVVVAAVAAAGLALAGLTVLEAPSGEPTRAVLDAGEQPPAVARALLEGETDPTVVEGHVTPGESGPRVRLVADVDRRRLERDATYAGTPVEVGEDLPVTVGGRTVRATVRDAGAPEDVTLDRTTERVLVEADLPETVAAEIEVGDEHVLAGRPVAAVEQVTCYGTADPSRVRALVGCSVEAVVEDGTPQFAGEPLRVGATVPVVTDAYAVEGEVVRTGALDERGDPVTCTVAAETDALSEAERDALAADATETVGGETVARVTAVEAAPDDADARRAGVRTDGSGADLRLEVELEARETASGLRFKRDPLEVGSSIPLSLDRLTIEPTVVAAEAGEGEG